MGVGPEQRSEPAEDETPTPPRPGRTGESAVESRMPELRLQRHVGNGAIAEHPVTQMPAATVSGKACAVFAATVSAAVSGKSCAVSAATVSGKSCPVPAATMFGTMPAATMFGTMPAATMFGTMPPPSSRIVLRAGKGVSRLPFVFTSGRCMRLVAIKALMPRTLRLHAHRP